MDVEPECYLKVTDGAAADVTSTAEAYLAANDRRARRVLRMPRRRAKYKNHPQVGRLRAPSTNQRVARI